MKPFLLFFIYKFENLFIDSLMYISKVLKNSADNIFERKVVWLELLKEKDELSKCLLMMY